MQRNLALMLLLSIVVFTGACGSKQEAAAPEPAPAPAPEVVEEVAPVVAVAVLQPRADSELSGMVRFTETADGVSVTAEIAGISAGLHGLHLHELGDCSSDDFKSTGGHFNPTDAPHGAPTDEMRHAGDFGNIEIGEDGAGHLELTTTMLTVADGPNTVVGRAVILHEGEDDLESQPTGAAGGRIGCGVVMLEGTATGETAEPIEGSEVDG
jgi:Cu-Zn family superoxide dismutase